MPKFRKKPIVVEAEYFKSVKDLHKTNVRWVYDFTIEGEGEQIFAKTQYGKCMELSFPTWLILEFNKDGCYPCKPDIFIKLSRKTPSFSYGDIRRT